MSELIRSGTVMIREGVSLPDLLHVESSAWMTGWRIVQMEGYSLGQEANQAGWEFLLVGNAHQKGAIGSSEGAKQRALRSLLSGLKANRFNALEVTAVENGRFCGVPFVRVTAYSRHLYESLALSHLRPAERSKSLRPS